jgi:hypothetical protein
MKSEDKQSNKALKYSAVPYGDSADVKYVEDGEALLMAHGILVQRHGQEEHSCSACRRLLRTVVLSTAVFVVLHMIFCGARHAGYHHHQSHNTDFYEHVSDGVVVVEENHHQQHPQFDLPPGALPPPKPCKKHHHHHDGPPPPPGMMDMMIKRPMPTTMMKPSSSSDKSSSDTSSSKSSRSSSDSSSDDVEVFSKLKGWWLGKSKPSSDSVPRTKSSLDDERDEPETDVEPLN